MKEKIVAQDLSHLKELVGSKIQKEGGNCDLNHIDTSLIKNMSFLFENLVSNKSKTLTPVVSTIVKQVALFAKICTIYKYSFSIKTIFYKTIYLI